MTIASEMKALLLVGDGYARQPSGSALEAMEPYVRPGVIGVPVPEATQVLIKVSLASINPSDVMFVKGLYGQPRVQGQPAGFEGVGTVVAAGDDAYAQSLVGKRIAFATGLTNWGAWADYALAEALACIPLIDAVRDEDAAAMIVNPLTAIAMYGIVKDEGHKAFVMTAGASQLCKLIIGLAKEDGYHPIVTVRRDDQIPLLKELGAAHVLNEKAPDFVQTLREVMKVEQPRIFLDAVTGPLASLVFDAMPKRSRWIIYGRLDPSDTMIREPGQLIFQQKHVEGFWLTDWMRRNKDRRGPAALEAQRRFADGRWSTDVTAVVPLAEAMARLPEELAKPNGKVFIRP
ncbi:MULTISPECIES: zinc-binding dehydrogenase [Phyllobacteriaceae]|jgi:NADPH:quinone reductase-like Zn-dependent oxidoreductase|uniref:NADH oxidoreductase n=1 Tax=Mesorhizobium hungaricum TaxID=1566387 RepID=A0A1C2E5C9_9HYPH|nr:MULTISPECIES: zinc-binding dehydrogenase [Mesorhizobium]MBN9236520.1 zinc-binding dehydrogenase [Mesorhizobium sp.]MDQ0329549.1 NADPH:quinone reductase-like Zn-dependent oxidoreductase [Mesorhizobium sp. YL-MeA3-2017]OCX22204.1 NADH oxidoreductase [Mesorhizobium hungaricum]